MRKPHPLTADQAEKRALQKSMRRLGKKSRRTAKTSGRSVFTLKKIIEKKGIRHNS